MPAGAAIIPICVPYGVQIAEDRNPAIKARPAQINRSSALILPLKSAKTPSAGGFTRFHGKSPSRIIPIASDAAILILINHESSISSLIIEE
jgi:hypothetical protein